MPLPLKPPVKPMLARPAKTIPDSSGLLFEPKWDGSDRVRGFLQVLARELTRVIPIFGAPVAVRAQPERPVPFR